MKTITTLLLTLALAGCITDPATGRQRLDPVQVNSIAALAVDLAAVHFHISPESTLAIKTAAADIAGIAAQAQANIGKKPAQADVAKGAGTPAIGSAVQAQLPNVPITQSTVDQLFAAAAATKAVK